MKRQRETTIQFDVCKVKGWAAMRGMTINDLARRLGVSHTLVHDIIRNRRSPGEYGERISRVLGVTLRELCIDPDNQKAA